MPACRHRSFTRLQENCAIFSCNFLKIFSLVTRRFLLAITNAGTCDIKSCAEESVIQALSRYLVLYSAAHQVDDYVSEVLKGDLHETIDRVLVPLAAGGRTRQTDLVGAVALRIRRCLL